MALNSRFLNSLKKWQDNFNKSQMQCKVIPLKKTGANVAMLVGVSFDLASSVLHQLTELAIFRPEKAAKFKLYFINWHKSSQKSSRKKQTLF